MKHSETKTEVTPNALLVAPCSREHIHTSAAILPNHNILPMFKQDISTQYIRDADAPIHPDDPENMQNFFDILMYGRRVQYVIDYMIAEACTEVITNSWPLLYRLCNASHQTSTIDLSGWKQEMRYADGGELPFPKPYFIFPSREIRQVKHFILETTGYGY